MATAQPAHVQLRDTLSRVVHRGLGVEDYWRAVSDALNVAVPSEGSCLMTMDPATMLPTAEFVENGMPADAFSRPSLTSSPVADRVSRQRRSLPMAGRSTVNFWSIGLVGAHRGVGGGGATGEVWTHSHTADRAP
jgi:hypothetical protein